MSKLESFLTEMQHKVSLYNQHVQYCASCTQKDKDLEKAVNALKIANRSLNKHYKQLEKLLANNILTKINNAISKGKSNNE